MSGEIVNKVAEANIEQIDLITFKNQDELVEIDLKDQLWEGFVLKEKDFRAWIKDHDWSQYANKRVFVHCSADAIVPSWAFMLVTSNLVRTKSIHCGDQSFAEEEIFFENLNSWNIEPLNEKRVMVKGCSNIPNPNRAYVELTRKLQPVVKSLMFGEPCSAVPVYKKKA